MCALESKMKRAYHTIVSGRTRKMMQNNGESETKIDVGIKVKLL